MNILIPVLLLARLNLFGAIEFMKVSKPFPAIIDEFPKFDFIIHYDNTTKPELDLLLKTSGFNRPITLLVNYDELFNLNRPVGYQFVNIVYMNNPFRFDIFSGERRNVGYNDAVIFIVENFERYVYPTKLWNQKGLNQSACVILYDISSGDFYYVHFYVGGRSGLLNKISVKQKNETPRLLNYMNMYNNFKGHTFNVGYFSCPPFIDKVKCDGPDECKSVGIDSQILNVMSHHLNFRFRLITCMPTAEGNWITMINDVHSRRLDWAVGGITRTVNRMELVDFTSMLHMESYAVLYAEEKDMVKSWDNALTPFQIYVWFCVITFACFIAGLLKLASGLMKFNTKLCAIIMMPFRTFTEQPIHHAIPSFLPIKILLATWLFTSIIITTAYKSKLASSMITSVMRVPDSILDLYDMGYDFQTDPDDWTVLKESLSEAYDTRYRGVLSKSRNDLGFCKAIKKVLDGKIAFVDEETLIQYTIWRLCKEHLSVNDILRFRKVRQELLPSIHAWPLQQTAPYTFRFSNVFNKLVASGIIEHWYKFNKRFSSKRKKVNAAKSSALTTTTFCGPTFILFTGVILSTVVFLSEHIYAYNYRR